MDEIEEFLGRISRGEDTTLNDVKISTGVVKNEYEMPPEPKFYSNESLSLPVNSVNVAKLRVPSSRKVTYEANDYGIVKVSETFDQDGESLYGSNEMIIPKDVFVAAYNAYIKDDKNGKYDM